MGIQQARDILFHYLCKLDSEVSECFDHEKAELYDALAIAVGILDYKLRGYCNLPKD